MSAHTWLEKAEELRLEMARVRSQETDVAGQESLERLAIARWLRTEFSAEPAEDTQTLALFPDQRCG
jgi:hypothetical protein